MLNFVLIIRRSAAVLLGSGTREIYCIPIGGAGDTELLVDKGADCLKEVVLL
jgi:hypothetical protein